jgi:hypothetical protein
MMHRPDAAAHVEPVARLQRAGQVQLGVSDRACQIGALGISAAIADDSVQPVPCVFFTGTRGPPRRSVPLS